MIYVAFVAATQRNRSWLIRTVWMTWISGAAIKAALIICLAHAPKW